MSEFRDPFAPSIDPDIPTPTRADLLKYVNTKHRDGLAAGSLPSELAETLWAGARAQWDERQRAAAKQRGEQSVKGTRVPGQTADERTSPQEERDRELLAFMSDQVRAAYDAADFEQKQIIWAANERAFEEAEIRKQHRRLLEEQRMADALDMLQRFKEDPDKADQRPPENWTMPELLKWHEYMSQAKPTVPHPKGSYPPTLAESQNIPLSIEENLRPSQEVSLQLGDDLHAMADAVTSPPASPNDKPWHKRGDLVVAVVLALGAAVLAIAGYLLPPKAVSSVIFWLVCMFVLLAAAEFLVARYREWSWFKTVGGIVLMAILVLVFAWFAWPVPPS